MSLISSIVAFAKADATKKGVPVLINFLQGISSAQSAVQRAAALAKFEGDALAAGAQIGQDILLDLSTTLQAELASIEAGASAQPAAQAASAV
jgi:hypothetical protein